MRTDDAELHFGTMAAGFDRRFAVVAVAAEELAELAFPVSASSVARRATLVVESEAF